GLPQRRLRRGAGGLAGPAGRRRRLQPRQRARATGPLRRGAGGLRSRAAAAARHGRRHRQPRSGAQAHAGAAATATGWRRATAAPFEAGPGRQAEAGAWRTRGAAGAGAATRRGRAVRGRRGAARAHARGDAARRGRPGGPAGASAAGRAQRIRRGARAAAGQRGLVAARARRPGWVVARALPARIPAAQGAAAMIRQGATLLALLLAWLLLAPLAQAQGKVVRAWLDRDHIALGETATLNIEVGGATAGTPDYAPLLRDFRLSGHSSSRSFQQVNGRSQVRTLFGVALEPLREGVLEVPPLEVAGTRTPALELTVDGSAPRPAHVGDIAFIEAEADARAPFVQQAVGYVVRLYVAVPLMSGQLDQAEPDGATLQRVGEDVRYTRDIDGRRYTVIERHYLLIPERSGPLEIPGARFRGRGVGGFFDDFFGGGNDALQASGAPKRLQVRPIPDAAPQPWLPLHDLS